MALDAGTTIGPYEVVGLIGQGGMGEVYRARDTKLDRDVALKVLPEAFTSDPDRLARFDLPDQLRGRRPAVCGGRDRVRGHRIALHGPD